MLEMFLCLLVIALVCRDVTADLQCYPNRTIHFTNPDSSIYTHFKGTYEAENGTKLTCISYADYTNDNIYFDCHSSTTTMTAYFSSRNFYNDRVLKGDVKVYTFQCNPIYTYNVSVSDDLGIGVYKEHYSTDPLYNITAKFYDSYHNSITKAHVGDTVYFVITGPTEYALKPLECTATGGYGEYETLISNGCTTDDSLVSDFYKDTGPHVSDYKITVYVFKFYGSDSLTITCNVRVCIKASCYFNCGGPAYGLRRSRHLLYSDVDDVVVNNIDDAKLSTIANKLEIIGVSFGGSNQTKGTMGCMVVGMMLCLLLSGGKTRTSFVNSLL